MASHTRWGRWRLLHNSNGQRCSVGCSQRNQPTPNLLSIERHRTTPLKPCTVFIFAMRGGCNLSSTSQGRSLSCRRSLAFWSKAAFPEVVLSVSDAETEAADQSCQSPASPKTTDATMADEEASKLVSVLSSPSEPSTLPIALRFWRC